MMELSAPPPRGHPLLAGLRRPPSIPASPLLLPHLSSCPITNRSLFASHSAKSLSLVSDAGWGRPRDRPPRARASDEDASMVVVHDDAGSKRVDGPSFLMRSSYGEGDNPDGGEQIAEAANNLLSKLNLKIDSEEAYGILFYVAGALAALWISAAFVSSIDSLPVFPKVMEVVGLGFTIWFSTRYLIFKENRDELFTKLDELKEKILGPSNK
ncbi:uncharacterized protein LOC103985301 [Musa acuminata AAA Group]|uniref:(wild Malaysian banana) hypothetical protein n=1 Tax=Musa acuminata subsp. malaccensis TaxID=214687 RepID=A0A804J6I0_MUSAM|nr:PREDICTED: uncharacterized protein LOC103985301 [Musa acuminata subsp. malaccensis]CAG1839046.1 unnamed protein product [Musa acuminata subsp. malaccensis]